MKPIDEETAACRPVVKAVPSRHGKVGGAQEENKGEVTGDRPGRDEDGTANEKTIPTFRRFAAA